MTASNTPKVYVRRDDDAEYDGKVQCENPRCTDPKCLVTQTRNAFRYTLGSLVETLSGLVESADCAEQMWGECRDPDCTFEEEMLDLLHHTRLYTSGALAQFLGAVRMWKQLPKDWPAEEVKAAENYINVLCQIEKRMVAGAEIRRGKKPRSN